jgi:hypothetical protein
MESFPPARKLYWKIAGEVESSRNRAKKVFADRRAGIQASLNAPVSVGLIYS